jgi:bisphosphoglycerate-dependent phosphoglycerate mutase
MYVGFLEMCKEPVRIESREGSIHGNNVFYGPVGITMMYSTSSKKIIVVRHGESLGNLDETEYATTPDSRIGLAEQGVIRARHAGNDLAEICRGKYLFCYVSPYTLTVQIWQIMKQQLDMQDQNIESNNEALIIVIGTRQEPKISEQQFGTYQVRDSIRHYEIESSMNLTIFIIGHIF